jgi:hypothetical protein
MPSITRKPAPKVEVAVVPVQEKKPVRSAAPATQTAQPDNTTTAAAATTTTTAIAAAGDETVKSALKHAHGSDVPAKTKQVVSSLFTKNPAMPALPAPVSDKPKGLRSVFASAETADPDSTPLVTRLTRHIQEHMGIGTAAVVKIQARKWLTHVFCIFRACGYVCLCLQTG